MTREENFQRLLCAFRGVTLNKKEAMQLYTTIAPCFLAESGYFLILRKWGDKE